MADNTALDDRITKVSALIEALPYIKRFAGHTLVIKYGGSLMEDRQLRTSFAADIVLLKYVGIHPIVVHGGGKDVTQWMKRLGKEPTFVQGIRVTDAETMEIAEIAFVADMSGVCSSGGTRVMTRNPTNPARMKMKNFRNWFMSARRSGSP